MSVTVRIAFCAGIGLLTALLVREGTADIVGLLSRAGWIMLWLAPLQGLPLLFDALGWRPLIKGKVRLAPLFLIVSIRQAINRLLPVANVGGEIAGIRLLTRLGIGATTAIASVIVEVLCTLVAQFLFVALGLWCSFGRADDGSVSAVILPALLASIGVLVVLTLSLRDGRVFARIERLAKRLVNRWFGSRFGPDQGASLDRTIQDVLADGAGVFTGLGWLLASLVSGCLEPWLALRWLGHPIGFAGALTLESLTQAARSVFFMIPAGLGVQEAGLIGAGHLFGLSPDIALAVSIAKRMREIIVGVPALLAWQWLEGRTRRVSRG